MRVFVTGSLGKIGREAVLALKRAGHRVTGLDLRAGQHGGVRTAACDCTDFGEVMGALSGIDTMGAPEAIVHLAGIPAPGLASDQHIFEVNTISTYNVFSAAARLGIRRIVWGSSETILGLPFSAAMPPAYLPLDAEAPDRPGWSYSLAKQLGESMADTFLRWHPELSIASLRFSNVFAEEDYAQLEALQRKPGVRQMNLWGYVDARDAGEACRLAVEADLAGHQRMVIAAADSVVDVPSAALAAEYFPEVPVTGDLTGHASLLSSACARELIGYVPAHSWRTKQP